MSAVLAGSWDMGYMSVWRTCRIRRLEQLKPPNHSKSAVSSKDVFWTPKEDTVLNWNTGASLLPCLARTPLLSLS